MSNYKKSEETKNLILKTAAELFYEKGYKITTVRDIASEAGLSVSRLNYHFHSKAEVAAIITKAFLKSLHDEIYRITFPLTSNIYVRDIIHLRYIGKTFIADNSSHDFFYEIAKENILTEIMLVSTYRHFIEQAEFWGRDFDTNTLRTYTHIFVSTLVQFIIATHDGELEMPIDKLLDIYNNLHFKLLDIDPTTSYNLLQEAKQHTQRMRFEMPNLQTIHMSYVVSQV